MLRLSPTVISLTMREVENMELRRREQKPSAIRGKDRITGNPDAPALPTRIASSTSVETSQASNDKGDFSPMDTSSSREPLSSSSNQPPAEPGVEEDSPGRAENPERGIRQFEAPPRHDSPGPTSSSPGSRLFTISPRRIPRKARLHHPRPTPTPNVQSTAETTPAQSTPGRQALSDTDREAKTEPRLGTGLTGLVRRAGQPPATVRSYIPQPFSRALHQMKPDSIAQCDIDAGRRFRAGDWRKELDAEQGDSSHHFHTPIRSSSLFNNRDPRAVANSPSDTSSVQTIRNILDIARHRLAPSRRHGRAQTQSPTSNSPSSGVRRHIQGSSPFPALQTPRSQARDFQILDEEAVFNFQIYDDSLPGSLQPQTPQNLPEARHRSQLLGSYTAPERLLSPLPVQARASRRQRGPGRRSPSPGGLQTPGLQGLYGGIENTDDSTLFERAEMAREQESDFGE